MIDGALLVLLMIALGFVLGLYIAAGIAWAAILMVAGAVIKITIRGVLSIVHLITATYENKIKRSISRTSRKHPPSHPSR